jgi:hypothetical protein
MLGGVDQWCARQGPCTPAGGQNYNKLKEAKTEKNV